MQHPVLHLIVAARPNFMKVAPLYHALEEAGGWEARLVHTGQHYDANMSDAFFRDLGLPEPDQHLGVGAGSHAEQTGRVMIAYEALCQKDRPDAVLVAGDVNSTVSCGLAAKKLGLPLVHLEAGLRSGDRTMPEELNRIVTDSLSDLHLTPSPDADAHLRHEGIPQGCIHRVGNIMIDAYRLMQPAIARAQPTIEAALPERFAVVTMHRPGNVDDPVKLGILIQQLHEIGATLPLLLPLHPRTADRLERFGFRAQLEAVPNLFLTEPLGYVDFMSLVTRAHLVITDSGGLQEETTYLGLPCLTLRPNTERGITVTEGSNRLVPPEDLARVVREVVAQPPHSYPAPPALWDGHTAGRVVEVLDHFAKQGFPQR
jgi:UDP-N-acetylglucosamine 2-epimerase (non-hydrolysing)